MNPSSGTTRSDTSKRPRVLIVPHEFLDLSLRLPPMIRKAGFDVDLLCIEGHLLAQSRYVDQVFYEETPESLLQHLKDILSQEDCQWRMVIVVDEPVVRQLISTNSPEIFKHWQKGAHDPIIREFILGKLALETVYQGGQVKVPPGKSCHTIEEIRIFGDLHGWPVIVKPPETSGGLGITRCDSPSDLEMLDPLPEWPVLAQKFVHGREAVVEMFCSGGRALAWLASFPIQRWDGPFSHSTAREFMPVPALRPLVDQVASFTRFEGFCGFDCIEDEATGTFFLIEFHPRSSSGLRFARASGVDFTKAFAAAMNGGADGFPCVTQGAGTSVEAHYFPMDLDRIWERRDWRGLLRWIPSSRTSYDVFWDDFPLFATWAGIRFRGQANASLQRIKRWSSKLANLMHCLFFTM